MVKYTQNLEFTGGSKGLVCRGEIFSQKINKNSWAHKAPPPIITKVKGLLLTYVKFHNVMAWLKFYSGDKTSKNCLKNELLYVPELLSKLLYSMSLYTNCKEYFKVKAAYNQWSS